jgi:hypothetical protein
MPKNPIEIPAGTMLEDVKFRKKIIRDFYKKNYLTTHPDFPAIVTK